MLRSLVGSEMCIRDSVVTCPRRAAARLACRVARQAGCRGLLAPSRNHNPWQAHSFSCSKKADDYLHSLYMRCRTYEIRIHVDVRMFCIMISCVLCRCRCHTRESHCGSMILKLYTSTCAPSATEAFALRRTQYTASTCMQHQGAFLTEQTLTVPMRFRLPPNLRSMEAGAADVLTAKHRGLLAHDVQPNTMHAAPVSYTHLTLPTKA